MSRKWRVPAMKIWHVSERLPKDGQYVCAHVLAKAWVRTDVWVTARFVKGLSMVERQQLPEGPRRRTWCFGDEGFNNNRPYRWDSQGPMSYFGQEVDYWFELPNAA